MDSRELVFLAVRSGSEIVTVEAFESKQEISLRADIGDRRPMYCTASGKAILAFLPGEEVDEILRLGMPPLTSRTITSTVVMHHELETVKDRGFAWDDEERIEGVRCVASPVFNRNGGVLAAISIAVPAMRTSFEHMRELGLQVLSAADAISKNLGSPAACRRPVVPLQRRLGPGVSDPLEGSPTRGLMRLADSSTD
jgi:DNA-binding IclR family transcriptional regulator